MSKSTMDTSQKLTPLVEVGRSRPKTDAGEKTSGRTQYIHDFSMPRMLYGKIKYSDRANARIGLGPRPPHFHQRGELLTSVQCALAHRLIAPAAAFTASMIWLYPVHRQRLPARARLI